MHFPHHHSWNLKSPRRVKEVLKEKLTTTNDGDNDSSLPMLSIADTTRNKLVSALGEFIGTFLFLFFSFAGTQIATSPGASAGVEPNLTVIIFIALCFGVSLTANVWAFYRVSGGLFNPVVTLALIVCGGLPVHRGLLIVPIQIIAGICAAGIAEAMFPGPLNVDTVLGGGTNTAQGFFIELILTAQLVFVILMLAVEKHRSTFLAPVGIGLSFFLSEIVGVYYTGGSLNPARSFGPAVVNRSFPGYFWIYVFGPTFGSLLACFFYAILRTLRYYEVNPDQDADGQDLDAEAATKDQEVGSSPERTLA
ncbi:MIP family channel protein [Colletotrichum karsti]|uniref:MIP family channel protein n=1 Tax=Colletotrichum karsti TaxID=1095194 RepID=A0A9P6HXP4_9PEZI|nr:MIP family channel protein [Colletotrichum karsti]KAF9872319.1 MIP family channel protein [Colletotrichum karsti]